MKKTTLSHYFSSQEPKGPSIEQKAAIYENFLNAKTAQEYKKGYKFYKRFTYGLSTFAVFGALFFGNFFGIFTHQTQDSNHHNNQSVEAQQIGRIVSFIGDYTIYDGQNRVVESDIIAINDYVNVAQDSSIEILVSDDFSAQVSGPAQFRIIVKDDKSGYSLAFINGGDDITVNKTKESEKNISVQTSDGVFVSNSTKQSTSFSISKNKETQKRTITNKSDTILEIKGKEDGETIIIPAHYHSEIAKDKIDGDIIILSQTQIDEILADSGSLEDFNIGSGEGLVIASQNIVHTIDEQDKETIRMTLDKAFLESEYSDLVLYYALGDNERYDILLNNINQRLNKLAPLANTKKQSHQDLQGLTQYIKKIIEGFEYYHLEKETYENLSIMIAKFRNLSTHPYGLLHSTAELRTIDASYVKRVLPLEKQEYH